MDDIPLGEKFDTGLSKIRQEIKSRLVHHGLFGSVTVDGTNIELVVKGKTVGRSFDRQQIESCQLRVGGVVLSGIISMVEEVAH